MSYNVGHGIIVIEVEEDAICELCGKTAEVRPYGPNGEEICFDCGIKNEPTTTKMLQQKLFGDKLVTKVLFKGE
jgi:hypothetical protein